MIAWRRESEAARPWATWGLLAATLLAQFAAGGSPELHARLGLLPADPRLAALLGHLFLHGGAFALLGTLFFAAAAGPWLEGRLGRALLLGSYFGAGLAGATVYTVIQPDAETPWLGASAAVAGWLGLLGVSARGAPADLLGVAAGRAGSLLAPGWAPAALWFGGELAGLASGEPGAVLANAAGFGFGAVLALGLERSGLVEREERVAPAIVRAERARAGAERRPGAAKRQPLPSHPEQLEAQLGESGDPALARAYLAHAEAEGRLESARAVVTERLFEALDARRRDPAVALWCALIATGPAPAAGTDKLLQLASWVRAAGHAGDGTAALHAALKGADAAASAKIARSARRSDPVICYRAAERALENPALGASDKSALEGLRLEAEREVAARGVILVPGSAPVALPPSVRPATAPGSPARVSAPGPARSLAIGEGIELAPAPELAPPPAPAALPDPERSGEDAFLDAFHAALHKDQPKPDGAPLRTLRVREALPRALDGDTLVLDVPDRGAIRLRLTRIHAVALAGVRGISERAGDKPVLLVDLCLSAEGEPELQVLRLRSDRFDPRRIAPSAETSPLKALRAFVGALAAAAHAPLLPADDVAGEGTLRIFRDLATYQREVLGAA